MALPTFVIVVEDGTRVTGSNSYLSKADADTILGGNPYAVAWFDLTQEEGERYLSRASLLLDANMQWKGWKNNSTQSMQWPRIYAKDADQSSLGYSFPLNPQVDGYFAYNQIPDCLKRGTAELALRLLSEDTSQDADSKGISSLSVGGRAGVSLAFDSRFMRKVMNDNIEMMLSPIGSPKYRGGAAKLSR